MKNSRLQIIKTGFCAIRNVNNILIGFYREETADTVLQARHTCVRLARERGFYVEDKE